MPHRPPAILAGRESTPKRMRQQEKEGKQNWKILPRTIANQEAETGRGEEFAFQRSKRTSTRVSPQLQHPSAVNASCPWN
jgi:hypothetical protein